MKAFTIFFLFSWMLNRNGTPSLSFPSTNLYLTSKKKWKNKEYSKYFWKGMGISEPLFKLLIVHFLYYEILKFYILNTEMA